MCYQAEIEVNVQIKKLEGTVTISWSSRSHRCPWKPILLSVLVTQTDSQSQGLVDKLTNQWWVLQNLWRMGLFCHASCTSVDLILRKVLLTYSKARLRLRVVGTASCIKTSRRENDLAEGKRVRGVRTKVSWVVARCDWGVNRLFQSKWTRTKFSKVSVGLKAILEDYIGCFDLHVS